MTFRSGDGGRGGGGGGRRAGGLGHAAAGAGALPDEAARIRVRTELDQTFLVEAGAGTGKTQLLVDRIENLIRSGRARMRNIVAITFTEKAAVELRVQIRQRIDGALRQGSGEARDRLRTALADLEIAPVSTIHAFASDLLRERPVEAGVDPAFAVTDELVASLFRTEAWDRWLEKQKDAAPDALRDAIEYGIGLSDLRKIGDELLRYRDVFDRPLDRGPRPPDPLDWLRAVTPEIRGFVGRIARDCLDREDNGAKGLLALGEWLDTFDRLAEAEVRRSLLAGTLKLKIGGRQDNWRTGVLRTIKERLVDLHGELEDLRTAQGHWLAAGAVNWLRGYIEEYQALKAREGMLDFDDLLLAARNLLRDNKAVRRDFQERFEAILVDEFQDTDPLQAEIIFYLAEDGAVADSWDAVRLRPGKLFIVGDPKQSIYAFRRADIETYELAKEVLGRGGAVEYITANFRSVQEILDAVNATFRDQMKPPPEPEGRYQPKYVALEGSTTTRKTRESPVLVLLYPEEPDGDGLTMDLCRECEAEAIAAMLRDYVDRGVWTVSDRPKAPDGAPTLRPAAFGDVALLFRGMTDVPIYEDALKRYDIPYRVTSSRTFYKREEVGWLLNVLHAIEHPTDAVAVWGALRSPLFGASDREIYEFVSSGGTLDYRIPTAAEGAASALPGPDPASAPGGPPAADGAVSDRPGPAPAPGGPPAVPDSIASAWTVLRNLHEQRNVLSVPRMVEEVLSATNALATFLLTLQGEQRVANLQKVVTLARALEESGILTFRAFVHWLRDMEEQAVDEAESPTVEEGDNVVRIMSIHAAKGLEFPIVVLPDLARGPVRDRDHVLLHRVKHEAAIYIGRVAARSGDEWRIGTRNYETLKGDHERREAAERLRVLYVAMTRAKDALVVAVPPEDKRRSGTLINDLAVMLPENPKFGKRHKDWLMLDGAGIPKVPGEPPAVRLTLPDGPTPEGDALAAERSRWVAERAETIAVASATEKVITPSGLVDHDRLVALKAQGARLESEAGGKLLGTLVHEVLAAVPLDRPDLAEDYARYFAAKRGKKGSIVKRVAELVTVALRSDVVKTALGGRYWREVPFVMTGLDGMVEGAIDLVIEDAAGNVTIVDYKTDSVTPEQCGELEAIYAPQLKSYVAVIKSLGIKQVSSKALFLRMHR
jgi:ATP-dependent helicase/nuclease subunit A